MKIVPSRLGASLGVLAAATLCVTPAMAHGWGGPPPPPRHHHHRGGGGDLLAGLLIVGGIAAIASAASNANKADSRPDSRSERYEGPYESDGYVEDYAPSGAAPAYPGGPVAGEPGYATPYDEDAPYGEEPGYADEGPATSSSTGAGNFGMAVDTCTGEVEKGERNRVDSVDKVGRMNGRVAVEGVLSDGRGFACSVDETGRVRSVAVDGHAMI